MVKVVEGEFDLVQGKDDLSIYKFNTNIANHFFCSNCGVHCFHNPRSAPDIWSINLRCIEDISLAELSAKQVYGSRLD